MSQILIIEDSLFQRTNIKNILKKDEYELIEASNALEGLGEIENQPPDCILLDLLMPEMDGIEFLKVLQKKEIHIPVIVMTADIQETTRKECIDLGAHTVLSKPVKEEEVRKTVRDILNQA